jgi:hypothetical protein
MRALFLVTVLLAARTASDHAVPPIPSVHGTATIDGLKSPGERDAVTPIAVFSTGGLSGSKLYVMDDDVNIYLGLFVPDSILTNDVFWTRFDSKHDGITMAGDDEVNGNASNNFFDSHFDGVSWAIQDLRYQGSAAAAAVPGGAFFEIAHAINTGDLDDMLVGPGDTIGLCAFFAHHGTIFGSGDYPDPCLTGGLSQTDYVDYTISNHVVGAEAAIRARAFVSSAPNPLHRGAELAIYYGVTARDAPSSIGLYSVSGRRAGAGVERAGAARPALEPVGSAHAGRVFRAGALRSRGRALGHGHRALRGDLRARRRSGILFA